MTEAEKYLLDAQGYLVIRNALTSEQVDAANAAVDAHADRIQTCAQELARGSATLAGRIGRADLGGLLTFEKPHCDIFRQMMALPTVTPYLHELLGTGFRLEAAGVLIMDEGAEGFWFHEGGEPLDRSRTYLYKNGRMYCGMTNIAFQLAPIRPGDGGFAVLPGSHKANFPCPDAIRLYEAHQDRIVAVPAEAGDAILFVECLMHGSLPWRASHQRRTALYRYMPGVFGEGVMGTWTPPAFYDELTDAQKAVISMPHYRFEDKGSRLYREPG